MSLDHYREPIRVSVAFIAKAESKDDKVSFAKIKYGSTDRLALTGDRTVGNLLEQSVPFLTSLWLHAVFVSPASAAKLGWAYLAFRAFYPFVFYKGMPYLLLSTLPGYAIIALLVKPLISV